MKEISITQIKICPRCGQVYHEPPALSRIDNQTLICPDCGTREALESTLVRRSRKKFLRLSIVKEEIHDKKSFIKIYGVRKPRGFCLLLYILMRSLHGGFFYCLSD